jgi:stage V sporulation protein SpoVS
VVKALEVATPNAMAGAVTAVVAEEEAAQAVAASSDAIAQHAAACFLAAVSFVKAKVATFVEVWC